MEHNVIPFPLEDSPYDTELTIRDTQFLTVFAAHAIQALAKTGRSSTVIWEGEPPELPYRAKGWELSGVKDEYRLPIEVQRRINIVRNTVPIKQVLIAHELPPEPRRLVAPEHTLRRANGNNVFQVLLGLALITTGLVMLLGGSAITAAIGAVIIAVAKAVGVLLFCVAALLTLSGGLDPAVVCILDDGCDSWLMVGYWYQ